MVSATRKFAEITALVGLCLALAGAAHFTHQYARAVPDALQVQTDTLLPSPLLRRIALSYRSAAADLYYLRAVNAFGDKRQHKAHYPWVAPLLERCVSLDAYFASAYLLAGQALAVLGHDVRRYAAILQQGTEQIPDHWQIGFFLGFGEYFWLHDDARAAVTLARVARLKGAPPQIGPLAAQLSAAAQTPEIGLRLIDTMLEDQIEPERQESLLKRRQLLLLEVRLKRLQEAKTTWENENKRKLTRLNDLVSAGIDDDNLQDPLGGIFYLSPEGVVKSQHDADRLRILQEARGQSELP